MIVGLFLPLFLGIFQLLPSDSQAVSWLAIGMSGLMPKIDTKRPSMACRSMKGFSKRQVKLCKRNIEHMDSVRAGARVAYLECQFQFQKRRWNCTMMDSNSAFDDVVLKDGTREAAFVHAISAAGIAHKVTRDCSRGVLDKCGCDQSVFSGRSLNTPSNFRWSGCSDNVHYGIAFARAFVDTSEKRRRMMKKDKILAAVDRRQVAVNRRQGVDDSTRERMLMNLHNNRAGRQALAKNMRTQCKCHGLSGSCELKTCWRSVPTFRQIGSIIKDKFDGATEVQLIRDANERRARMVRVHQHFKRHTNNDLIYLVQSPDYCIENRPIGVLGTQGRVCNRTSPGIDGCELLCCHRGFRSELIRNPRMCNCKFHYCCRVNCQPCVQTERVFLCV